MQFKQKQNTLTSNSLQNLWCRDMYWEHIIEVYGFNPFRVSKGCHLRKCQYNSETCRGAHSDKDIKILPHIVVYNKINKTKIEWVKLHQAILKSFNDEIEKINNEEHKKKLLDVSSLNFIQIINLWREMACFYRKMAKEMLQTAAGNQTQYIPSFSLSDNWEDIAWPFERLTRYCPIHEKMNNLIKSGEKITIWDVCLATGINCKEGIHKQSEKICIDDFLTGKCSCISIKQIQDEQNIFNLELVELTKSHNEILLKIKELENFNMDQEWELPKNKLKNKSNKTITKLNSEKDIIEKDIKIIKKRIDNLQYLRPIHYTELGMIPFDTQYSKFKLEEEEKIKAGKKESWEHDLIDIKISKPIVKLIKLGKK